MAKRSRSDLHTLVINSLDDQIAVVDQSGNIIDVNFAWSKFGTENGFSSTSPCLSLNYLDVLKSAAASGDTLAEEAATGIIKVLSGKLDNFYCEYPCHGPNTQRMVHDAHNPIEED